MTLDPGLKERLVALATERGSNLNDTAVAILSEQFGVEYEPTGIPSTGIGDSDRICIDMSPRLRRKINVRAAQLDRRRQAVLNDTFRTYLDARRSAAA